MKILVSGDHAGYELKGQIGRRLQDWGFQVVDLGPHSEESVDYPDYAQRLGEELEAGALGILICGTGIGVSIAANKIAGIRAALCKTEFEAEMARKHNDANVLCLGSRSTMADLIERIVRTFVDTEFEGGRHARRVAKINALDELKTNA